MFFFFFVPPIKKKNQKEKSSSLKTLRALRFSLMTGLSELGLWPSPQTGADKLFPPSTAMLTDRFNATYGVGTRCSTSFLS
ncbi:MAG: hypothetical protein Q7U71_06070 [bacterium]|nr:hypothetical protein [bacterium]